MDVIFLHSNELNKDENLARAKIILGQDVIVVDGSGASSIKNAYEQMLKIPSSQLFMMIEADNFIYPECKSLLTMAEPTKFYALNKFGFAYEHGGIKILDRDKLQNELLTNANIHEKFEVSANLHLPSNTTICSEHRFDWSHKNEWTTIAKELTKLYFWDSTYMLNKWLEHETPRQIFNQIKPMFNSLSISNFFEDFFPSLNERYDALYS